MLYFLLAYIVYVHIWQVIRMLKTNDYGITNFIHAVSSFMILLAVFIESMFWLRDHIHIKL